MLTALREWSQKRKLRAMLKAPRSMRGFRSAGQLGRGERGAEHIGANVIRWNCTRFVIS
jgi:hypothetical protein